MIDKGNPHLPENKIVCSSYVLGPDHPDFTPGVKVIIGNEFHQGKLVELVEKADYFVAHNTKFEYGWLERCGLDIANTLAFCTQIGEYVKKSNRPGALNLNACLKRHGMPQKENLGALLLKNGICPSTWPRKWLVPYAAKDSVLGEKLFLKQREILIREGNLKTAFTRNIFTPVIYSIEDHGMHIDAERVYPIHVDYNHRLAKLRKDIDEITGGANPKSPPQMREVLYEQLKFKKPTKKQWLTSKGEPTTSFDYIKTLKPSNKKQKRFLELKKEYGKVYDALSKFLNKVKDCVDETEDHILTADLNQTITVTQRLSSTGKNYGAQFQNFPRIFKPIFSARYDGWLMGEIDQAQLEYRVAVWFGQDDAGIYDITHDVDSHAFTAEHIYGDKWKALAPTDPQYKKLRTNAKAHTFKPLYGGQSGTREEVRYYKAFKDKHQGITNAQEGWKREAINSQRLQIPSGLWFYFPGTRVSSTGYVSNTTKICNYPVQSFATADIVPIGVVYQWHLMRIAGLKSFLVNTIHDSSIGEVHPDEVEEYSKIGEYSFVDLVYEYLKRVYEVDFNIPLEAEAEFNKNWNDSEDWRQEYLGEPICPK